MNQNSMQEKLNIDYHTRRLVLKALNTADTYTAAARQLGITRPTLAKLIKTYKISQQWVVNETEQSPMRPLQSVA